jgi:hypothetical protein
MRQVVYLPVHPELSGKELQRLIRAALEFDEDGIPATSTDCPSGTASP